MEDRELYLSVRALCKLFNRAERTVRNWIAHCGAERIGEDGSVKYYLPDVLRYYLENIYKPPVSESLEKVKLEQEKLKLRKMELEIAEREGNLLDRDRVEVEWAQRVAEMGARLAAMPFRLTPKLAGRSLKAPQVQKILKDEVREFFRAYAREGEYTPAIGLKDEVAFRLCWEVLTEASGYDEPDKLKVKLVRVKGGSSKRKGKKSNTKA